jgi:exopolysaccharide biosynthesis polyprenyl glycosylphosphotransferase
MSLPLLNLGQQQASNPDWAARLIPGVRADFGKKKPEKTKMKSAVRLDEHMALGSPFKPAVNTPEKAEANSTHQGASPCSTDRSHELSEKPRRNVLIVGAGPFGQRIAWCIQTHPEQGRIVCGFLDDRQPLGNGVIGRIDNLAHLSRSSFIDEVILAAPNDREMTLQVLREARRLHLDVEMAVDLFGCEPAQSAVGRVGSFPIICLHREPLPVARLMAKRAIDLFGAVSGLLLLAPLMAVIAGLIKWDSPGPLFYSAPRVGRKGRTFPCYKFRTMVNKADDLKAVLRSHNERSGPCFKIADDPRITRVGRWLRRYSLDELPQLWNVLRGEMSLVGPRPHPLDDVAFYKMEHLSRLDVTPGVTGLWQVTARRDPSFEKGMKLDREYIEAWSLSSDLKILFKTVVAVFRGSGA